MKQLMQKTTIHRTATCIHCDKYTESNERKNTFSGMRRNPPQIGCDLRSCEVIQARGQADRTKCVDPPPNLDIQIRDHQMCTTE